MTEKVEKKVNNNTVKERFSFELRINDNIVCQRYFRIIGFKNHSLYSEELVDTVKYCARLIQDDLKSKSMAYYWYTAPQVFEKQEQLNTWLDKRQFKIEPFTYVGVEETGDIYFWDGETMNPFDQYFNKSDYMRPALTEDKIETAPCVLKFAFLDNDREVCSTIWDGNVYPRFIRNNIDLSNSKNKYKNDSLYMPLESAMVQILNHYHKDLIPVIVKEFCICCAKDSDDQYTDTVKYGDKVYPLSVNAQWNKYVAKAEKSCRKKTENYFKNL